jgi:3-oxoadipate enol-lactonase
MRRTRDGLAYEIAGSGPAVLLLHTGLMDRHSWDPHWEPLARRFTAIRYDLRAFGDSEDPAETLNEHADAVAVLDAAGAERAALVGVSYGGRVAIDVALAFPERVSALVAVSAQPGGWQTDTELTARLEEVERAYESGGLDAANEAEMRIWVDGPHRSPDQVDPELRARVADVNRRLLERQAPLEPDAEELQPPAAARLAEVAAPALVVTGALDYPSVLAGSRALADAVGADEAQIEGAAHLAHLERPDEFLAAIVPFLERHA